MRQYPLMRRQLKNLLSAALPEQRWADRLISFLAFVERHKRLPRDQMLFNDVLYQLKTSRQILDPLRVFVSDKEFVKMYVAATVGYRHCVPTLAVLRSRADVDQYHPPGPCCIKPTHMSGKVVFVGASGNFDRGAVSSWLQESLYKVTREANYRTLTPKIIVEPLVFGRDDPEDYKFYCYRGSPRLIAVDSGRHGNHYRNMYDNEWRPQRYSLQHQRGVQEVLRPKNLDVLLGLASKISSPFEFIRVDMYTNGHDALVGELTNVSGSACSAFVPADGEQEASRIMFG